MWDYLHSWPIKQMKYASECLFKNKGKTFLLLFQLNQN